MSAIQTLRSKSGLITIVIGVALLSFVVTGLDPSLFTGKGHDNVIAEIDGTEYPYESYSVILEQFQKAETPNQNDIQKQRTYENAWSAFLNKAIFEKAYLELGLGVYNPWLNIVGLSEEEAKDVIIGENIDPEIQYYFKNPQTGEFDKEMLIQTLSRLNEFKESNPEFYNGWIAFEKGLHEKTLQNKYTNLVSKGFYPTTLDIEMGLADQQKTFSFEYVKVPYSTVQDSSLTISESEIATYYDAHKDEKQYKQDASVTIDYVTFDIIPTQEDIAGIESYIANKRNDFIKAKNDVSFLSINSDIAFNSDYVEKGKLSPAIDSFAFSAEKGEASEVYFENNSYKVAKVSDIRYAADSATVRHILFGKDDPMRYYKADSVKKLLERPEGADFASLVTEFSTDKASVPDGGVYKWFKSGDMVKPFQDSSFFGEVGKFYLCETVHGVHLIEVLKQSPKKNKYVQVQYFAKEITYSAETRKEVYKEAVRFASENQTKEAFDKSIESNNLLTKRIAENTLENQRYIVGLDDSRDIIRWAHTNKEEGNIISDIFTCGDKYVIAAISKVNEEGQKDVSQLEDEIRAILLKEKSKDLLLKKAESIDKTSIQTIAAGFNVRPLNSQNASFGMQSAPNLGVEPKVIATASVLEIGKLSNAIAGEDGIFFIVVSEKGTNATMTKENIEQSLARKTSKVVTENIFPFVKSKAVIEDNRIYFQ